MRGFAVFCVYAAVAILVVSGVVAIFFCHNSYQSGLALAIGCSASLLLASFGFDRLENE